MSKLKILPGFVPNDSFSLLAKHDIKEVYCGFFDEYSEKRWPVALHVINRRGEGANFYGIDSFNKFAKEAKKNNINIFLAFNIPYTNTQIQWVLKSIKQLSKYQSVKGLIVGDMNILLNLKRIGYKKQIIISTSGTIFNEYAVEFYSKFGADRFVLDRQLTAKKILDIAQKYNQYQYEIFFLMGDGCLFVDGYCSSMHAQEISKNKRYNTSVPTTLCMNVINKLSEDERKNLLSFKCNICLIYYICKLNNITLKIPNRTITDSNAENIINLIKDLEIQATIKAASFNKFHLYCKKRLEEYKQIKCNPKVCLCRDLFV